MNPKRYLPRYLLWAATIALIAGSVPVAAQTNFSVSVTLKNEFIEQFKHRVTIATTYIVDQAHDKPKDAVEDGDIHIAGRAPEIGLPCVAEIMNAKLELPTIKQIQQHQQSGVALSIVGVWRLWSEHAGGPQVQGSPLLPFTKTNPVHVFEIHPITRIGSKSFLRDQIPIVGYTTRKAEDAFPKYEKHRCEIVPNTNDTTTIRTLVITDNYPEFRIKLLTDQQFPLEDGRAVFASIHKLTGEKLVDKIWLLFVKNSKPEKKVKKLKAGDELHLLGIPRISLWQISERLKEAPTNPDVLKQTLPYEIVVVGLYD